MLKKAGIVAAVAAVALLIPGPMAFAEGPPEEKNRDHGTEQSRPEPEQPPGGLIDLHKLLKDLDVNVCPDINVAAAIGNVLGILGLGSATAVIADAPITCKGSGHNG